MYAQSNGDMQSFRRGEHIIPANYAGNAFTLDDDPKTDGSLIDTDADAITAYNEELVPPTPEAKQDDAVPAFAKKDKEPGLLSGIFTRLSRGFELDDILLIGLILLLLQGECERRDETVILLALLLIVGF